MMDWTLIVLSVVLDASVRATLLAAVVLVLIHLFAVRTPHVRHTVWLGVLLAMLLMPGLRLLLPDLPVPLESWSTSTVRQPTTISSLTWVTDEPAIEGTVAVAATAMGQAQADAAHRAAAPAWLVTLATIYLAGVLLLGLQLLHGWARAARLARSAQRVHDAAGAASFPVFESARVITPVTMGVLRPRILLPAAWRTWTPERLDAVLAHERAHAARRDPLVALVAHINRAVFWFHPLAWWLERALSASAEEVCDAAGVQAVGRREHYAEVLLEFAREVQRHGGRLGWHGSGVAGHGSLMQRIERVLAQEAVHRVPRSRTVAAGACCLAAACFVAALEGRVTAGPSDGSANLSVPPARQVAPAPVRTLASPEERTLPRPDASRVSPDARATQGISGSIEGVVLDPSGSPIADVAVTVSAFATEIVHQTDALGRYAFVNLTPGTYRLQIQLPGFKTLTRPRVIVAPGMQTLEPAVLELGSVAETVTIRPDASGPARPVSQATSSAESTSSEEAQRLAAVAASPDDPMPYLDLARFYDRVGRSADADRVSRRVQALMSARQAAAASAAPRTGGDITPPVKVRDVPPVFPPGPVDSGGIVILEGTIGTDGRVQNAKILRGASDGPAFDEAALAALERWLYTPALLNGQPVEVVAIVTMNFTAR